MKTKHEIIANLLKAKKFFEENGRTTSTLYNEYTGCACLLGGVGIAAGSDPLEMHYGIFYEETPGYAEAGIAFEEAQALADNLPDSYFAEREYRTRDNADYTDVYYFNDHVAGYGPEGDQKVYDLIDRTAEALRSELVPENLRKAADVLDEHGWTTGTLYNPYSDCFCALGAIGQAVVGDGFMSSPDYEFFEPQGDARPEAEAFADYLRTTGYTVGTDTIGTVYHWNDGTHKEAVQFTLRRAADALEAEAR